MPAFCADILVPKNFNPKTQLCNFWRQNMGAKCECKMLMKLKPGGSSRHPSFESLWHLFLA
jgi:hypothetical protein